MSKGIVVVTDDGVSGWKTFRNIALSFMIGILAGVYGMLYVIHYHRELIVWVINN